MYTNPKNRFYPQIIVLKTKLKLHAYYNWKSARYNKMLRDEQFEIGSDLPYRGIPIPPENGIQKLFNSGKDKDKHLFYEASNIENCLIGKMIDRHF